MKENIILIKSIEFSIGIKNYCNSLYFKKETVIANQLLRCGMAIGANISEAQHAESRSDFIHKMKKQLPRKRAKLCTGYQYVKKRTNRDFNIS